MAHPTLIFDLGIENINLEINSIEILSFFIKKGLKLNTHVPFEQQITLLYILIY